MQTSEELLKSINDMMADYAKLAKEEAVAAAPKDAKDAIVKAKAVIQEYIDQHQKALDESWHAANAEAEVARETCVVNTLRSVMDAIDELA